MSTTKKYWKGIEELKGDENFVASTQEEFNSYQKPTEFLGDSELEDFKTDRRDFLKYLGFGVTAATLAACEAPVQKAIPYVIKPEEVEPGLANYYASTYYDGTDFANILVKTREGRPIFISGNKSGKTKGGVNARVNASVLGLYDSKRAISFMKKDGDSFVSSSNSSIDSEIVSQLNKIAERGGNISLLTSSIISPSTMAAIEKFKAKYATASEEGSSATFTHVMYDAISNSGALDANNEVFGKRALPLYDYTKAKVIVSVGSDFVQNDTNAIAYAKDYALRRNPDGAWMSRHYQFEGAMSVTGSNADYRTLVSPAEQLAVVANLYNLVSGNSVNAGALNEKAKARVEKAAAELKANKGASIVVSGSNDKNVQLLVIGINEALGNYGSTLNMDKAVMLKKGNDAKVQTLIADMNAGKVDALFVAGVNPAYSLPTSLGFADAASKVGLKVSFADRATDETALLCDYLTPDNHYLESWNDFMAVEGEFSFQQPTIQPLFDTRQFQDTMLTWAEESVSYYDFIKENWNAKAPEVTGVAFENNFNQMIHDGMFAATSATALVEDVVVEEGTEEETSSVSYSAAASKLNVTAGDWQVEFYASTGMGDGTHSNNPWLQELPDPVTKVTWDNYIAMSPAKMEELGLNTMLGQKHMSGVATLTVNGNSLNLPVVAQPGMPNNTVAVAVGYGRDCGYEESMKVGQNVAALMQVVNGSVSNVAFDASLSVLEGEEYNIASTQTHHTMMGRKIVNEVDKNTYDTVDHDALNGWNKPTKVLDSYGEAQNPEDLNMWSDHGIDFGHRWGMSIDLNKCTGCSACVTACHTENNVPVVGKEEVNRARDMHWLRIDRYYTTEEGKKAGTEEQYSYDYAALEVPEAEPKVVYQPVMCQHCNHAPCETVCPVAATTHSEEGLNQMAYNRCFGTRYCANNCPYKVRRFNWFNYTAYKKFSNFNPAQDDLGRMVLNPDVVVRTRGVMEKCSMCVQRIQSGKLDAKKAGKPVQDGDIQTACSEACSFGAITFGDVNDKGSQIKAETEHKRAYNLIEELGVQPNIWYQTKVRNVEA